MEPSAIERDLDELETRLDRLRALYEQYFMGIERLEPQIPRKEVDRRIHVLRKEQIRNTGLRFKFQMLIQRYNTLQQYWGRVTREIDSGTYKRDVLRAAARFGAKDALTILGKKKARQYAALAESQAKQRGQEPGERAAEADEFELDPADLYDDDSAASLRGATVEDDPADFLPLINAEPARRGPPGPPPPPRPAMTASTNEGSRASVPGPPPVPRAALGSSTNEGSRASVPGPPPAPRAALGSSTNEGSRASVPGPPPAPRAALGSSTNEGSRASVPGPPPAPRAALGSSTNEGSRASVPGPPPAPRAALGSSTNEGSRASVPGPPPAPRPLPGVPSQQQPAVSASPAVAAAPSSGASAAAAQAGAKRRVAELAAAMRAPATQSAPSGSAGNVSGGGGGLDLDFDESAPPRPPERKPQAAAAVVRAPPVPAEPAAPKADPAPTDAQFGRSPFAQKQALPRQAPVVRPPAAAPPAAPVAAAAGEGHLPEQRLRQIYAKYVDTKRQANESTAGVTYEKLAETLKAQAQRLRSSHPNKTVDYEVVIKDGKTHVKPVLK